eukprot:290348-Pyramimonas_sp.AAC.1
MSGKATTRDRVRDEPHFAIGKLLGAHDHTEIVDIGRDRPVVGQLQHSGGGAIDDEAALLYRRVLRDDVAQCALAE